MRTRLKVMQPGFLGELCRKQTPFLPLFSCGVLRRLRLDVLNVAAKLTRFDARSDSECVHKKSTRLYVVIP